MKILFITPRLPYPPIKGDKHRAYNQIKHLSKRHDIALVSFIESPEEKIWVSEIAKYCSRVETVLLKRWRSCFKMVLGAASAMPFQCLYYHSFRMRSKIKELVEAERPDVVHFQLVRAVQYADELEALPRVLDFVDALSLNFKRRFQKERLAFKPLFYLEWKKIERYEKEVFGKFDKAVVSSRVDKEWLLPGDSLLPNPHGVDTNYFNFHPLEKRRPNTIVFSGNMGYFPNVDAASYFANEILPMVKVQVPGVEFLIIGSSPPKKLLKLSHFDPAIKVTGYVEDIRDYLGRAAVAVCPMRAGSGLQFKVLEALAVGTPLVATSQAVAPIDARYGEDVIVADTSEDFAGQVAKLLKDPSLRERLGRAGRKLVEEKYTWEASVSRLEDAYIEALRSKGKTAP